MITIESGMLIALGFLAATLLGLLLMPAFWARAVRLTTRRIKDTIPLSEMEIEADRDRIRAEYAIKMHKLETLVEQVKLAGARQQIEINRRDARINMLEADLERLQASYEEAQNARRVLEQAISDRLPRVESRLTDAKKVLNTREQEVHDLSRTAEKQVRALAQARAINAQQQAEIERLTTTLAEREVQAKSAGRSQGDNALKSELERLRAKTREQARVLAHLQSLTSKPTHDLAGLPAETASEAAEAGAPASAEPSAAGRQAELERQLRVLKDRNEDQAAEISRLKAAIAVLERDAEAAEGKMSIAESRIALKARLQSLEVQSTQQAEIVKRLRSELAAANEKLARQAAHFTGELKRLGAGGVAGGEAGQRRDKTSSRHRLADRLAHALGGNADGGAHGARPLPPEMGEAMPGKAASSTDAEDMVAENTPASRPRPPGQAVEELEMAPRKADDDGEPIGSRDHETAPLIAESEPASRPDSAGKSASARFRLLDRIAGLSRTG